MNDSRDQWRVPSDMLRSRPGMLDLWRIRVPALRELLPDLLTMLDAAELRRCMAYRFDHLRERFAIRRGVMRVILSHYLEMPSPRHVGFTTGRYGKPRLLGAPTDDPNPLSFNLTESGDVAVLAISAGGEVGVDVEQEQLDAPPMEILPELAAVERAGIAALPPPERGSTLYRVWVRKEAYLKARGDGLRVDLRSFGVSVSRCVTPFAMQPVHAGDAHPRWEGMDFVPEPGWAGCVVASAKWDQLCCWDATVDWLRQQMPAPRAESA